VKRLILLALILISGVANALSVSDIEKDVMCTCGCARPLENCECATADRMRSEIADMINRGMTRDEIISELQSMYGKEVLINPPKEGVFLGLWYYPAFAVGVGIAIIYYVAKRRNAKWYADPDEVVNQDEELIDLEG